MSNKNEKAALKAEMRRIERLEKVYEDFRRVYGCGMEEDDGDNSLAHAIEHDESVQHFMHRLAEMASKFRLQARGQAGAFPLTAQAMQAAKVCADEDDADDAVDAEMKRIDKLTDTYDDYAERYGTHFEHDNGTNLLVDHIRKGLSAGDLKKELDKVVKDYKLEEVDDEEAAAT